MNQPSPTRPSTVAAAIVGDGQFALSPQEQQRQQEQLSRYREANEVEAALVAAKPRADPGPARPSGSLRAALERAVPAAVQAAVVRQNAAEAQQSPQFELPIQPAPALQSQTVLAPHLPRSDESDAFDDEDEKDPFGYGPRVAIIRPPGRPAAMRTGRE